MRHIIRRLVVVVGLAGGLVTAAAHTANATIIIISNHSEPIARDHR
jgi:hypothetical protein